MQYLKLNMTTEDQSKAVADYWSPLPLLQKHSLKNEALVKAYTEKQKQIRAKFGD